MATAHLLVFSGRSNPERHLSQEQEQGLLTRVRKLKEAKAKATPPTPKLGARGFTVDLEEGDICGLIVQDGVVGIYRDDQEPEFVKDSAGVGGYLRECMKDLVEEWWSASPKASVPTSKTRAPPTNSNTGSTTKSGKTDVG